MGSLLGTVSKTMKSPVVGMLLKQIVTIREELLFSPFAFVVEKTTTSGERVVSWKPVVAGGSITALVITPGLTPPSVARMWVIWPGTPLVCFRSKVQQQLVVPGVSMVTVNTPLVRVAAVLV